MLRRFVTTLVALRLAALAIALTILGESFAEALRGQGRHRECSVVRLGSGAAWATGILLFVLNQELGLRGAIAAGPVIGWLNPRVPIRAGGTGRQ